jgi:hypothetical protein
VLYDSASTIPAPKFRGRQSDGEVPEWSIGAVSKTVVRASVPWVRIPPSPPAKYLMLRINLKASLSCPSVRG